MDIQVGDRVTYLDSYKTKRITIIKDAEMVETFKIDTGLYIEILKIERPKYEVIEEKKELLTEEEKEYIKNYTYFNKIDYKTLRISIASIEFINGNFSIACYVNTNDRFNNIKSGHIYEKEELGL